MGLSACQDTVHRVGLFACAAFVLCAGSFGMSSKLHSEMKALDDEVKSGAQLYDNWPKITGAELTGNHPLYPAASKKSGVTTWRCKECHGWDYVGKDGRYAEGSHYTGIAGVMQAKGKSFEELDKAIADGPGHAFSEYLSPTQTRALAKFVKEGTVDMSQAVSPQGKALGNMEKGAGLFSEHCAACHNADGNRYDFEEAEGVQGIGFLANENPQETLHKILWGNPGTGMPSAMVDDGLSLSDSADILGYSQSLK